MKKIYMLLALCVVLHSSLYNTATAAHISYTDYGVSTEAELNSVLNIPAPEDEGKRINVNSNINLLNNMSAPTNNPFIINGNSKTIDGGAQTNISNSASHSVVINDLTLTNFNAPAIAVPALGGQNASLGGAILHQQGELNIFNSHFSNNLAEGGIVAIGGAIANYNTTDSSLSGNVNIYNSSFVNNKAGITTRGQGGAIYNAGTMNVYSSEFLKNIANYADSNSVGGAIMNEGTLNIYNSIFGSDNIADANKSYDGGAIYNTGSNFAVYNSTFKNNVAVNNGGAIYNMGPNFRVYDSNFINNTANTNGGAIYNTDTAYIIADKSAINFTNNTAHVNGGAIYNSGNLYLIANNGGIDFSDNSATGLGNDIYSIGPTYMNAGLGDITFNSGIHTSSNIYINNPIASIDGLTVPTTGRVVLNGPLTGAANIYLNDGMLKLGENGAINFSSGDLRLLGNSILNLANGDATDIIETGWLTIPTGATPIIWMDIKPSNNTSDSFNIYNYSNSGQPKFVFHILDDGPGNAKSISGLNLNGINSYGYINHYAYTFTGKNWGGFEYTRSGDGTTYDGLAAAIADTNDRSFSLVGSDYVATSDFLALPNGADVASAKTLTVFGTGKNGLAISGNGNYKLFDVPQYASLNIVDAALKNARNGGFYGAAISNAGTLNVYDSLFNNNNSVFAWQDVYGGAIYNTGTANISNTDFTQNFSSSFGGAIANRGTSAIMNIFNSSFTNNRTNNYAGGAISNSDGATLNISSSTFGGDDFSFANQSGLAGAIYNNANLNVYNSTFKFNNAIGIGDGGGAIVNGAAGTANIFNSTFNGNDSLVSNGGAISNNSGTMNLYNSTFINNTTEANGGAIYSNGGTVNLIASGGDTTFTGNTAISGGNDIYLENGAKLNLNAQQGMKISFDGGIKSSATTDGTININKQGSTDAGDPPTNVPISGEIVLNAPVETSTVNLYGGTLTLKNDNYLDGNVLNLSGGTLNMQNGAAETMALESLEVSRTTNIKIDANLATGTIDKIDGTYTESSGKLSVSSIKLLNDSTTNSTTAQLLESDLIGHDLVRLEAKKAYTPIYQYNVSYDDTTGQITFNGGGGSGGGGSSFNPAILSSPVSANVGAYMTQISVYNEALSRSELFMSLPQQERLLMRQRNKYANIGGNDVRPEVFSPTFLPDERGGLWFKQYTSFENVPMNNGPNVSNIGYGVMIGADSPIYHFKNGYDGYLTTYVAYNGSHQNYDQVGVNQNGGALGVTGTLYKGNFFTALTASVGDSVGQANTIYGVDNFNTLLAGLALKSGYNFEMAQGKFILQPSLLAAYTFANTFDYTTASGVNITSNPMNALQIAPGVKLIANMKNGWQPYLAVNMVFNIMDKQRFQANDAQLPQLSIDPYVEYGFGVQRRWGERFTGFGQAMLRGGGRNGVTLQFGFRMAIGK